MSESVILGLGLNTSVAEKQLAEFARKGQSYFNNFRLQNDVTRPLGEISSSAAEFEKSLRAANARVLTFGASVGLIYGVQKAFSELVKSTIEVEKSLTDVNVILNLSQQNLKSFGAGLFEIARNTGQSFNVVVQAATELARQGLGVNETLKRTRDALILTRLSGLDAKSSVEALTAAVNSFSDAALDSTQIVNKFANVDQAFAVSSADLAEAIKRVGSTAQDAGVNIDELIAIVTSAQQTTARGGAIIGNAFKSIFTRLERPQVLSDLRELGISVKDAEGAVRPALDIFGQLANKIDDLTQSQKAQVEQQVGSLYQINILKAALGDLSNQYSIHQRALDTSASSTDEAIQRNKELNATLSAQLSATSNNFKQIGAAFGQATINPGAKLLLGQINGAFESLSNSQSDGIGAKIGKGIMDGIANFISGPGLLAFVTVLGKLGIQTLKFVKEAGESIIGLNQAVQSRAQLEGAIVDVLKTDDVLTKSILSGTLAQAEAEKIILSTVRERIAAQTALGNTIHTLANDIIIAGANPISAKKAATGVIPGQEEVNRAKKAGYDAGIIQEINFPKVGKVIYNSAEQVKDFGLSVPAILPPKNSKAGENYKETFEKIHGFNPYRAGGLVPNFAGYGTIPEVPKSAFDYIKSQKPSNEPNPEFAKVFGRDLNELGLTEGIELEKAIKSIKDSLKQSALGIKQLPDLVNSLVGDFQLSDKEGNKILKNLNKSAENYEKKAPIQGPFNPQTLNQDKATNGLRLPPLTTPTFVTSQAYLDDLRRLHPPPAPPQPTAEQIRHFLPGFSKVPEPDDSARYQATLRSQANSERLDYLRRQNLGRRIQEGFEVNRNTGVLSPILPVSDADLSNQRKQLNQLRQQKYGTAAFATSFIAPIAANIVADQLPDNSTTSRGTQAAIRGVGNAVSFGATAFALSGDPRIAAIGAAIGALTSLSTVIKGFTDTLPELEKELDRIKDSSARTTENLGNYGAATEKLESILTGETKLNPRDTFTLPNLRKQREQAFAGLNPEQQKGLLEAQAKGGTEGVRNFTSQEQQRNTNETLAARINEQLNFLSKTRAFNVKSQPLGATRDEFGVGFTFRKPEPPVITVSKEFDELIKKTEDLILKSTNDKGRGVLSIFNNKENVQALDDARKSEKEFFAFFQKQLDTGGIKIGNFFEDIANLPEEKRTVIAKNLFKESISPQSFENRQKDIAAQEQNARNFRVNRSQFSNDLFNNQLSLSAFNQNSQIFETLKNQGLQSLVNRGQNNSERFISNQEPFFSPVSIQNLRNRSALENISNQRALSRETAVGEFRQSTNQELTNNVNNFLKQQLERVGKEVPPEQLSKFTNEFLQPIVNQNNKVQESILNGDVNKGFDQFKVLVDLLKQGQQEFAKKSVNSDTTKNEDLAKEFADGVIGPLESNFRGLIGTVKQLDQTYNEQSDAQRDLNNQIRDSIALQEKIKFGGGIANVLNPQTRENLFTTSESLKLAKATNQSDSAAFEAFNLASQQFPFTKSVGPDLEGLIKGGIANNPITGNQPGIGRTADLQFKNAFPQENNNLSNALDKITPSIDDLTSELTPILRKIDSKNTLFAGGDISTKATLTQIEAAKQALEELSNKQNKLQKVQEYNPDLKTPLSQSIKDQISEVKRAGLDVGLKNEPKQRPTSDFGPKLNILNETNIPKLLQSLYNVPRKESDFNGFKARPQTFEDIRRAQIFDARSGVQRISNNPFNTTNSQYNRSAAQLAEGVNKIKAENADLLTQTRQYEALLAKINADRALELETLGKISGEEAKVAVEEKNRAKLTANGTLGLKDIGESFGAQFKYNTRDFYKDLHEGAIEVGSTLKSSFKDAFKSFADGSKSATQALKQFGLAITSKIAEKSINISTDLLFSGAATGIKSAVGYFTGASKGGLIRGYSSGGVVMGGSGLRDDVPAKLTGGEYVIKKDAVDKVGIQYLQSLNATGSESITLKNRFLYDNPTRPNTGKTDIDPRLSGFGALDENNPQNLLRLQREEDLFGYQTGLIAYNKQKQAALDAYKKGIRNAMIAAYISAGIQVGAGAIKASGGTGSGIKDYGTQPSTGKPYGTYEGAKAYSAMGGLISPRHYAFDGNVLQSSSADKIPAMLTGGEFVVKKEVVDKFGKSFFDRINRGERPNHYADGGIVGRDVAAGGGLQLPSFDKLNDSITSLISAIRNLKPDGKDSGSGSMNNYFNFQFTVAGNGQVAAASTAPQVDNKKGNNQNFTPDDAKKLSDAIQANVYQVLIKEQRPNGLLNRKNAS